MNDLKKSQHAALIDFHTKIEGILAEVKNPTKELVEEIFNGVKSPDIDSIVPFTGYYSMDAAKGAFLSIDTTEAYYRFTQKITFSTATVAVTVSMNGTTSTTYPLDKSTTFDGKTLTIPNVLSITLTRQYHDGALVTFTGMVNKVNVTGSTQFNPIKLSTFNGNYTAVSSGKEVLSVNDSPTNAFDSSIAFDFGSGLQDVRFYTFTPLMFVLMFSAPVSGDKYVLMLGTAGSMGLACFIQQGSTGGYAFTIPPQ